MGLLTGPHQTSFSEVGSLTMRLSSGDRPVFAPENAVNAPVEVMAEPVSYTKASSYSVATDGLAICIKFLVLHKRGNGRNHPGRVVNRRLTMATRS